MAPAQPKSVVIITKNGNHINAAELTAMAHELAQARATGAFPLTTTPDYVIQAILDDHARLRQLREALGDTTELLSHITRDIQQRDALRSEDPANATAKVPNENMKQEVQGKAELARLVRRAFQHTIESGNVTCPFQY